MRVDGETARLIVDDVAHVLVPGGEVELGLAGDVRDVLARCMPAPAFARFDADGVIEALARDAVQAGASFSPHRRVTVPAMLVEIEPTRFLDHVAHDRDDDPADVLARACGARWRLPTPDEWEYLYSAGARTLFPWGDAWPSTPACPVDARDFTNVFGLHFGELAECTSERRVLGRGDPSGWTLNGFDGGIVYASAYRTHESHVAHFEWETYEATAIRRIAIT